MAYPQNVRGRRTAEIAACAALIRALLMRSALEFSCGWYAVHVFSVVLWFAQRFMTAMEVNSLALSTLSTRGGAPFIALMRASLIGASLAISWRVFRKCTQRYLRSASTDVRKRTFARLYFGLMEPKVSLLVNSLTL